MDDCEKFYFENKEYFEDYLKCDVSYGRGFLIFRNKNKDEVLVQFKLSEMYLIDDTKQFIGQVVFGIKTGKIRI